MVGADGAVMEASTAGTWNQSMRTAITSYSSLLLMGVTEDVCPALSIVVSALCPTEEWRPSLQYVPS